MTSHSPPAAATAGSARLRRGWWVIVGAFAGLASLFYAPILLGLRTFPDGDFTHHFLPFSLFLQDEVLAGRLPLWNPLTYSGHPFLADVQAAVFYPVSNALLGLTLPWTAPGARLYFLQLEAILQVALAGWFGVPQRQVVLKSGETSRRKTVEISGSAVDPASLLT